MYFTVLSIYFFIAVIITIYLGASVRKRDGSNSLHMLIPLTLLMSVYIYGYSQEISVTTYERAYFWNSFQYLAIPLTSSVWLHLSMIFTGLTKRNKWVKAILLYTIPIMSIILRLTNNYHHFYFTEVYGKFIGDRFILVQVKGPWYHVQVVYAVVILLLTLMAYFYAYRNKHTINIPIIRYMIGATILSSLALILKTVDLFQLHVDYIAIVMPINVIALYLAIFRHDFFGLKQLAFEQAFDSSKDAMILTDNYQSILDYNSEAFELFGRLGIKLGKKRIQEMISDNQTIYDIFIKRYDRTIGLDVGNEIHYFNIQSNGVLDDKNQEQGRLLVIRNVTEEQKLHEKLYYNATTDHLSGLLNRRIFMERSLEVYETDDRYVLAMIDIDHFKKVNDTYGHGAGDQVIAEMGQMLKEFFDPVAIIGRIGGEEFAVMMPHYSRINDNDKIEAFRQLIQDHVFRLGNMEINLSISIGVALSADTTYYEKMMIEADKALYRAKETGRNKVCYKSV